MAASVAKHGQLHLVLSSGIMFDALMEQERRGGAETLTGLIADRVKTLRTGARLSGSALAAEMNKRGIPWNRTTVAKLETGRRESLNVQELLALALVLDVPPVSLIADPRRDELIPVAEGVEVDPWEALLWMTGAGTLDLEPVHAVYQGEADLIWEGRVVVEMAGNLRRVPRFMGTEEQAKQSLDELHRQHLETMSSALERIEMMGAKVPRMGPHIMERARELGVDLPGQEG